MKKLSKERESYEETLAYLSVELGANKKAYDIVYATHIDVDGFTGVLEDLRYWAREFEKIFKGMEWDGGEYWTELDLFFAFKVDSLNDNVQKKFKIVVEYTTSHGDEEKYTETFTDYYKSVKFFKEQILLSFNGKEDKEGNTIEYVYRK